MRSNKMDLFAWIVVVICALTFAVLEITFIQSLLEDMAWDKFLEFNGATLSMFGALWTALGVRMSPKEYEALLSIRTNPAKFAEEITRSLQVASRFASFGAYCILIGGALLSVKIFFLS